MAPPTVLAIALAWSLPAPSSPDPDAAPARREIEISLPGSPGVKLPAGQLLERPTATTLEVRNAPAYQDMTIRFRAVPMSDLVPARFARPELSLIFECRDGFAAAIPATRVLGQSPETPRAFLAVEDPASPWPPLKKQSGTTAGPFYLIWQPSMRIAPEEWPYQISRIVIREAQEEFRGIIPEGAGADSKVKAGFQIYVRSCSPCHSLNGVGSGDVGPDLNSPMNPTEYFREGIFEKYVRDPGSLLRWPDQKMPSFPADVITDAELSQLRAYLVYMARRKNPVTPPKSGS